MCYPRHRVSVAAVPKAFDRCKVRPCLNAWERAWRGCNTTSPALCSNGGLLLTTLLHVQVIVALALRLRRREEAECASAELVTSQESLLVIKEGFSLNLQEQNPILMGWTSTFVTPLFLLLEPTLCDHYLSVLKFQQSLLQKLTHAFLNKTC